MDSINNFIGLLMKGDFFLIFLILMMAIIIGVIFYLVKLQINEDNYYDYDKDLDEEDTFIEPLKEVNTIKETKDISKNEPMVISDKVYDDYSADLEDEEDFSDLEEIIPINASLEIEDEEEDHTYDNLERPAGGISTQEIPVRHIEQSKFNFEGNNVESTSQEIDSIKEFEDEQEKNAIISASELENRINELKANGEYAEHEKRIQEYELEQENKAIISYEELLNRASQSNISYESEENIGGIHVGKVNTNNIESYSEVNEKPYYKEEAFLEAMKEFRRAL